MITALAQPSHLEQNRSLESQFDQDYINAHADRYYAPSVVIPGVAKEIGAEFNYVLSTTLTGDGLPGDDNIAGLGRASREVGNVINGNQEPYQLFDQSSVRVVESTLVDPEDQQEYTEINYLPPEEEKLKALVNSRSITGTGKLFARLILDASYPYKSQPDDGYVDLESRDPASAKLYSGRYDSLGEAVAKLCSNTESHFVNDIPQLTREIVINGELVAVQKHSGDHTAMLVVPAVLNGVRLPPGAVLIPEGNVGSGYKFGFGRLSMFNAQDGAEAEREFPTIAHRDISNVLNGSRQLTTSMNRFKKLSGEDGHNPEDLIFEYMQAGKQGKDLMRWEDAVSTINSELSSKLEETENAHVVKLLGALRQKASDAAQTALEDRATTLEEGYDADPKARAHEIQKVRQARLRLHKMFGAEKVVEVERLLFLKAYMEELVAV